MALEPGALSDADLASAYGGDTAIPSAPVPSGFDEDAATQAVTGLFPDARITGKGRTDQRNAEVHGAPNSMHRINQPGGPQAIDFVSNTPPDQANAVIAESGLPHTEFFLEPAQNGQGEHYHWGWRPKGGAAAPAAAPAPAPQGLSDGALADMYATKPAANTGALSDAQLSSLYTPKPRAPAAAPASGGGVVDMLKNVLGIGPKPAWAQWLEDSTDAMLSTTPTDPNKPTTSVRDTLGKLIESVPADLQKSGGGLIQSAGESTPIDIVRAGLTTSGMPAASGAIGAIQDIVAPKPATPAPDTSWLQKPVAPGVAKTGADLVKTATAHLKKTAPNLAPVPQLAYDIANGAVQMAPLMAASIATKNPLPVMGGIALQSYGDAYGDSRAAGRTPEQAQQDASFAAAANAIPAAIPFHALMQPGQKFMGKVLSEAGAMGLQNVLTTTFQTAYDRGVLGKDPNMTFGQAVAQVARSGLVGVFTGGMVGAGAHVVGSAFGPKAEGEPAAAAQAAANTGAKVEVNGKPVPPAAPAPAPAPAPGIINTPSAAAKPEPAPAPAPAVAATAGKPVYAPLHDPKTWAQVGWVDQAGNKLPLDAPGTPGGPPAPPVKESPVSQPPTVGPDGVPLSAGGTAVPIKGGGTRIGGRRGPSAGVETIIPGEEHAPPPVAVTPEMAAKGLETNLDPVTGLRPIGNKALREFRARMQTVIDTAPEPQAPAPEIPPAAAAAPKPTVPPDIEAGAAPEKPAPATEPPPEGAIPPEAAAATSGPEYDAARADIAEHRGPAPKLDADLLQTIRNAGGIKITDSKGAVSPEGQNVREALLDYKRPGLINNRTGLTPDRMRQRLEEQGWFGHNDPQRTDLSTFYDMLSNARSEKIFHPLSDANGILDRRRAIDEEIDASDVLTSDSPEVAAHKLVAFRQSQQIRDLADQHQAEVDRGAEALSPAGRQAIGDLGYEPGTDHDEEQAGTDEGVEAEIAPGEGPRAADEDGAAPGDSGPSAQPHPTEETLDDGEIPFARRPAEEAGAEGLPQTILPGAERSAKQLAAAREASGRGRMVAKTEQKPAGGLFEEKPNDDQGSLFALQPPRAHGIPPEADPPISSYPNDTAIKAHPDYRAAKGGDMEAAARLVPDVVKRPTIDEAKRRFGSDAIYTPVIAEEASGHNAIPEATAHYYAQETGARASDEIVQVNRAFHTGAGPLDRMISRPVFDGPVEKGGKYVLVDDVSVMGGSLAELANHIRSNGGDVAGVVTLANAGRTGKNAPSPATVRLVKGRFGDEIKHHFGVEPEALTDSEARYLSNFRDAEQLRSSVAKAQGERKQRLLSKGLREEAPGDEVESPASPEDGETDFKRVDVPKPRQTAALQFTPEFDAKREAVAATLRKRLNQLGLKDVALRVPDAIITKEGDNADGVYARKIIAVALDSQRPHAEILDHEAVHAVRRLGLITEPEWNVLSRKADAWATKYKIDQTYGDISPERRTEEAIAHAFPDWRAGRLGNAGNAVQRIFRKVQNFLDAIGNAFRGNGFQSADDVFGKIDSGEVGNRGTPAQPSPQEEPPSFALRSKEDETDEKLPPIHNPVNRIVNRLLGETTEQLGSRISEAGAKLFPDSIKRAADAVQMAVTPMAAGSDAARAEAKDFANAMRTARTVGGRQDEYLSKNFEPEQLERMWTAADARSVALQKGEADPGYESLTPKERAAVKTFQADANTALSQAREVGIVKAEGLPSYVPRMGVAIGADGKFQRLGRGEKDVAHGLDAIGRNLRTTSPNLKQRKYLTAEETERAMKDSLDPNAVLVKNFRTLPLATMRLNEAIAGRRLINSIKDIGRDTGEITVSEGSEPDAAVTGHKWFTLDHPAFKTYRPALHTDPDTGKTTVLQDEDGNDLFKKVPLYVRDDFEGPLRAVLSRDTNEIYKGAMTLKGKGMSVIMYSPAMHNAVIWGKAFPAAPLQMLKPWYRNADGQLKAGISLYGEGRAAKDDPVTMKEALSNGLDPVGHRYFNQDASAIMEEPNLKPGRSWTSQLLGYVPGLFDEAKGDAVKRAIDKAGDVWHNKLLWDLVGDLQMGLYTHLRDRFVAQGNDEQTAGRAAAMFANRYAGSLPMESMSKGARMTANLLLFSRSFTLSNVAAFKDLVRGLPKDVQSQILRDRGVAALNRIQGAVRRKAAALLVMDVMLAHLGLMGAQYALAWASGATYHPPSENEPDKEHRFLIGYQPDGTAIYGRLPTGKVGEELQDWVTEPAGVADRKLSPFGRLLYGAAANDQGFGQKIYDPYDKSLGGYVKNIGRIAKFAAESMLPLTPFETMYDIARGRGNVQTNIEKLLLPMTGVTVSKGAPGGPAVGEMFRVHDEHDFQIQEQMPEIRQKIADGDLKDAIEQMQALGLPRWRQQFTIKTTLNPRARLSPTQIHEYMQQATPEEREDMERYLDQEKESHAATGGEQHSELTPDAVRDPDSLRRAADAGVTWTRQDAVRAATAAGMPATARLLRSLAQEAA
jgi:hypothetical protein